MPFSRQTQQTTIIFEGGLDLDTPPTQVPGGRLLLCKNWIADSSGGYREFDGFVRIDGLADPVDSSFIAVPMDSTAGFLVGETVTQATTAATGVVLQIETEGLYLVATTGTFLDEFTLTGGMSLATGDATNAGYADAVLNSSNIFNDVRLAKENYYRDLIGTVPGEGDVFGAFWHQTSRVAVRNVLGNETAKLFKATAAGWTEIVLGHILFFDTLENTPPAGTVISDGNSNLATVRAVVSPTVGGETGYAIITGFTTGFIVNDIMEYGPTFATVDAEPVPNKLPPGGQYEWESHNFFANDSTSYFIYGVNNVGFAFQLDPVNDIYIPLISDQASQATDTPKYIAIYRNHLFIGFEDGFIRNSVPGNPYLWDSAVGAQENPTGAAVTGFNSTAKALIIYTLRKTLQLTGKTAQSPTDPFFIDDASAETGALPYTAQQIGSSYSWDNRGIIDLTRVQAFGDFDNAAISKRIRPLLNTMRPLITHSVIVKRDNMVVFFQTDGQALTVTFREDGSVGFGFIDLDKTVSAISNGTDETGRERILVSSGDGFVYELLKGRAFDGEEVERWLRPVFHHLGSFGVGKRFKQAYFNTLVEGRATLTIAAEFGMGSVESDVHVPDDVLTFGTGALYEIASYDSSLYDTSLVSSAYVDLKGHGDSIGLIVYHKSASDDLVTLKDVTYQYKVGSLQRGAR